jgi:hypothetical protein
MMVLGTGVRERQLPAPGGVGSRSRQQQEPQAEQVVHGVVVNPPRESRVSVRVEIVSGERDSPNSDAGAASRAEREREPQPVAASEAMRAALASEIPPPAAARLGSPDARQAALAYGAHAEWQPSMAGSHSRLSVWA